VFVFAENLLTQATMQKTGHGFLNMQLDIEAPVFARDTVHVGCEVIEARRSKSRPHPSLVRTRNRIYKQDGTLVQRSTFKPPGASRFPLQGRARLEESSAETNDRGSGCAYTTGRVSLEQTEVGGSLFLADQRQTNIGKVVRLDVTDGIPECLIVCWSRAASTVAFGRFPERVGNSHIRETSASLVGRIIPVGPKPEDEMGGLALIVGSSGIVGRNLAEHLLRNGWDVAGLARTPPSDIPGLRPIAADLPDASGLASSLTAPASLPRIHHDLDATGNWAAEH
jgi:hypothetical protein